MGTRDEKQNLLAEVHDLASLRHALGRLENEVRLLLEQAERNAARGGVPASLIAKAAGLTPGRITQILARPDDADHSPRRCTRSSIRFGNGPPMRSIGTAQISPAR